MTKNVDDADCPHGIDLAIHRCGWCAIDFSLQEQMDMRGRIYAQATAMLIASNIELNPVLLQEVLSGAHKAAELWNREAKRDAH